VHKNSPFPERMGKRQKDKMRSDGVSVIFIIRLHISGLMNYCAVSFFVIGIAPFMFFH
jgi:hypothetical protein